MAGDEIRGVGSAGGADGDEVVFGGFGHWLVGWLVDGWFIFHLCFFSFLGGRGEGGVIEEGVWGSWMGRCCYDVERSELGEVCLDFGN